MVAKRDEWLSVDDLLALDREPLSPRKPLRRYKKKN
jgi:hypothetical protein